MRGYFKVNLTGEDNHVPVNRPKRTGERRLAIIEKTLRKDGIEFVEDFDGDCVIVRYGDFLDDSVWEASQRVQESEPVAVCV